ncbi:hypothetical protein [Clostridium estertheticum]|uniref:hypothetical protein n=1 Tax=Clostridium estertheticum TaxID=238834 RepID=UPI001C0C1B5A|nr:hypothetical protein [Clostridium estertheticum]MBU3186662.1 hypothetical protein [Clostridium estertheticum]
MIINETNTLSCTLSLKNGEDKDVIVIFLNTNLSTNLNNFSINASSNDMTKELLIKDAKNLAGLTISQQYSEFETEIKKRATEMGYILF